MTNPTPHTAPSTLQLAGRLLCLPLVAAQAAVGGQAVMEGVMMRGSTHWAVALRRHDGDIVEVLREHSPFAARHAWARLPLLRGIVALLESLVIGYRALAVSAHYASEWPADDAPPTHTGLASAAGPSAGLAPVSIAPAASAPAAIAPLSSAPEPTERDHTASPVADTPETDDDASDANPDGLKGWQIAIAMVMAMGLSIVLFKLLPVTLVAISPIERTSVWFVLLEVAIKMSLFIGYLVLIGRMADMRRVFQYHSAEHKTINAWESGVELEPEAVNRMSRIHVRCGTAFIVWVFFVAVVVFGTFNRLVDPSFIELLASRAVLLPLVAGLSFELIRFAGRHRGSRIIRGIMAPGLWMQYLTTRECTPRQCEVAIRSLQLVVRDEPALAAPARTVAAAEAGADDEGVRILA